LGRYGRCRRIEPRTGTVDLIDAHHVLRQRLPVVNWSSVMTQKPSLTREAAAKSHVDSYSAHPLPR
jgi:hypothetical protein